MLSSIVADCEAGSLWFAGRSIDSSWTLAKEGPARVASLDRILVIVLSVLVVSIGVCVFWGNKNCPVEGVSFCGRSLYWEACCAMLVENLGCDWSRVVIDCVGCLMSNEVRLVSLTDLTFHTD